MRVLKPLLAVVAIASLSACVVAPYDGYYGGDGGYYGGGGGYYGGSAYAAGSYAYPAYGYPSSVLEFNYRDGGGHRRYDDDRGRGYDHRGHGHHDHRDRDRGDRDGGH